MHLNQLWTRDRDIEREREREREKARETRINKEKAALNELRFPLILSSIR